MALRAFSRRASSKVREAAGKHVPFGASGSGFYSAKTKGCFDVIDNSEPLLNQALDRALSARQRNGTAGSAPFSIADFGAADGGTSLPLFRRIIAAVRKAEPTAPILMHYEDQAMNDWQSVFKITQGEVPGLPDSYMGDDDNVYVLASGASFYQQCFAPASIDLAFCATAMHWLTTVPTKIPDALHSACTGDSATRAAFEAQAAKDWEHILRQRARELKPGGQMVIANFAVDEQGQFLGTSNRVGASMHHTFSELWQQVAGDEVHAATNFCNEYRPLAACALPFETKTAAVEALQLHSAKTDLVPCPFQLEWVAGKSAPTAREHAELFVPTTRTWSNSTFVSGATATGIAQPEADAMAEDMFQRYIARVAEAPAEHAMDYVHSYLHIGKDA